MASAREADIVIAGGGPAGLATAARAARRGFRTIVLERSEGPADKACGEGLMPRGVRALEALGALALIPPEARSPFAGIRYVLESGRAVDARFRHGGGLGIRRTALSAALGAVARDAGASIERSALRRFSTSPDGVAIETERGCVRASLLVGADGLQSPVRSAAGLALPSEDGAPHRFGLRRHYACAPWSDLVEVHWQGGAECYATPVGPAQVNIAFLWDPRATEDGARAAGGGEPRRDRFDALLARFPAVATRLAGAQPSSEARGSGPLWRPTRGRAADRVALVGDAAGYVDAITGQGISLALAGAQALVDALPARLDDAAALSNALRNYDHALRSAWRRYALPARALLALAHRPVVRRAALGLVARSPRLFALLVESIATA